MPRVFRFFRVVVVLRHLQARGPAQIAEDLSVSRAAATFFTTIFLVIVVLELSGIVILDAEGGIEGANIRTPSDALWWGYVAITTVGYGDRFPVTPSGRIIGIFLLTAGVALFAPSPASSPTRSSLPGAGPSIGCAAGGRAARWPSSTRSVAWSPSRTTARASSRRSSTTWSGHSWHGARRARPSPLRRRPSPPTRGRRPPLPRSRHRRPDCPRTIVA